MSTERIYLIVRSDLRPGQQIAQVAHAALMYGDRNGVDEDHYVIVLAARDAAHLAQLANDSAVSSGSLVEFFEPDVGMTALALRSSPEVKALFADLPLALSVRAGLTSSRSRSGASAGTVGTGTA